MALSNRVHMPPLDGATAWLDTEPLDLAALRGRVVVIDFWTLTCINWLRTVPRVRAWADAYGADGLVVLGVHTPEFSFEHDVELVRRATAERGIGYPVAVDGDYAIWHAFANRYWPALYFVDTEGVIREHHFGEGHYEESERVIQRLLGVDRALVSVEGTGVEAEADWEQLRSPETYLGDRRSGRGVVPRGHAAPVRLRLNQWAAAGCVGDRGRARSAREAGGSIAFRFHARDVHLVLARAGGAPIPFRVLLDGRAPGRACGVDVDADGRGVLDGGRMYQLVRQRDGVTERTIEITFLEAGAEAYAFTFG